MIPILNMADAQALKARVMNRSQLQNEEVSRRVKEIVARVREEGDAALFEYTARFDKAEIMELARRIGTYETSILPYEDCCTVFTPKHPRTRPTLELIEKAEGAVDWDEMIERAIETTRYEYVD